MRSVFYVLYALCSVLCALCSVFGVLSFSVHISSCTGYASYFNNNDILLPAVVDIQEVKEMLASFKFVQVAKYAFEDSGENKLLKVTLKPKWITASGLEIVRSVAKRLQQLNCKSVTAESSG